MNCDFDNDAPALKNRLMEVRTLIYALAKQNPDIGQIEESVKWGQASFSTVRPKTGTPVRIDGDAMAGTYSVFVPCATSLIPDFRDTHPDMFEYHGNREIRLDLAAPLPQRVLSLFISEALRYYLT